MRPPVVARRLNLSGGPLDQAIWIFRDDEFDVPIYAEPAREDLEDEALWQAGCEHVLEAFEGEGSRFDTSVHGAWRVGWKAHARTGITFVVAVPESVGVSELKGFLNDLMQRYMDEADDARFPEPAGVDDIVVDVIPPSED